MNNSFKANIFEKPQNTFISFKGYEFDINDNYWVLDINKTIDISRLWNYEHVTQSDVVLTLVNFARYSSSSHTANMCEYVGKYWDITGENTFSLEGLLNYKNHYSAKKDEYKVAMLSIN